MTCYTYSSYQSTQSSICYYLNHQFFQSFCPAINIIDAVMWIMSISSPLATMLRCQLRIYEESIFNFKTFPNYKLKQSMGFQKIFFWEKLSVQFRSQQKNFRFSLDLSRKTFTITLVTQHFSSCFRIFNEDILETCQNLQYIMEFFAVLLG